MGAKPAESPIEKVELVRQEDGTPGCRLRVLSEMPRGSGCSQFNGYEIRRGKGGEIEVTITHHEAADPLVACTADFPVVETIAPWGPVLKQGASIPSP